MFDSMSKPTLMVAALVGGLALFVAGFVIALEVRSVVADPGDSAPNPGHEWSEVEGHGIDGSGYWLGTTDNQALVIKTDGAEAMRVDTAGNVGIGTDSPGYPLHVNGEAQIRWVTIGGYSGGGGYYDGVSGYYNLWLNAEKAGGNGGDIYFLSENVERMRVQSNGNVGIGTADPQSALQVTGYVQLALTSGSPPAADCNEATEEGRMKFDPAADNLYICSGASGWVSVSLT